MAKSTNKPAGAVSAVSPARCRDPLTGRARRAVCCLLSCLLSGLPALMPIPSLATDVYKYRDDRGRTLFTDRKSSGRSLQYIGKWSWKSWMQRRFNPYLCLANRDRFNALIEDAAYRHHLSVALVHSVISAESCYDPKAISRAGAVGLMQLMPGTARRYGVDDRYDPAQNLNGGTRYLRDLLNMFRGDLKLALAAYNAGENVVIRYGFAIPPYPETQQYVGKVLQNYNQNLSRFPERRAQPASSRS